jgi:DNA-binding NtrC family response regulator
MKILMVDDDESMRLLMAVWVAKAAGFDLNFATNGDEALRCYAKHGPYDVVLTDIVHPGLNGLALSKAIRRKNPKQAIAVFTAGMSDAMTHSFQRLNIPVKP